MKQMKCSTDGLALIKKYEGLKLTAYKPVPTEKYYTIGYGHYAANITKGMTITKAIAEQLLLEDVAKCEKLLNGMNVNFRQGQFDALCSFIFNLGEGAFNRSTLKKKILAKANDADIAAEFKRWNKATVNGKKVVLGGLTSRREEEALTWML